MHLSCVEMPSWLSRLFTRDLQNPARPNVGSIGERVDCELQWLPAFPAIDRILILKVAAIAAFHFDN